MQEAEFQRVLIVAIAVGTAMVAIGATTLFFAFRMFGDRKPTHLIVLAALIVFIFACCGALFLWSFRG